MFRELLKKASSWEKLKNALLPVVVYGTGNGADRVFDEFKLLKIPVAAVAASDGFVRKRSFRGFEVKSISQLESELGDFVIALAFASPLPEVIENIKMLSRRREVIMPSVPVYGESIFNKDFFIKHLTEIETAYSLLADAQSKKVFRNLIEFQLTGNLSLAFDCETDKNEALALLSLGENESYLDLGAYRGDTVGEFLSSVKEYKSITAVEPDKKTFKKLSENCGGLKNTELLNCAVWESCGEITFKSSKGRGSSRSDSGEALPAVTVDSLAEGRGFTYIKADVEGAENELLNGAENTLKLQKPKLNIAAYHRSEDIFYLANKIHSINPEYKIYLRHHPHISLWDTNIYCK